MGLSAPGDSAHDAARAACAANGDAAGPLPLASAGDDAALRLIGDSRGSVALLCCGEAGRCACAARLSKLLRALEEAVEMARPPPLSAADRSTSARSSCRGCGVRKG